MKAVIQRVTSASVMIQEKIISQIDKGLLILLGITQEDTTEDIQWLAKKIVNLRIFNDENKVMNNSLIQADGEAIVVSQFTLMASTKKGSRPSYMRAAKPDIAIPLYEEFIRILEHNLAKKVGTGVFGADMKIELQNDGPVTIIIDTKNKL
ncbi:MAG: D-tyrosyl-tRNA(Tyr) deacylase [Flavobacteriaceae bacterium]|nr:D-tyrosyl-tRNA(Tyr) deacylase [Flavobacteriaceae bacterium]